MPKTATCPYDRYARTGGDPVGALAEVVAPPEIGRDFGDLSADRRLWLTQTGARYIWTTPPVVEARRTLYGHLALVMDDPHCVVVDAVARSIQNYVDAFGLFDSWTLLSDAEG